MSRPIDTEPATARRADGPATEAARSGTPKTTAARGTGPAGVTLALPVALPSPAARLWTMTTNFMREQWRSVLIWGVSLGLVNVLYVALFPGFKDTLNDYLRTMPAAYLQFLGLDVSGEVTIQTFLSMEMFAIIAPLALPFFAILLGAKTVAGAEDRLQLDVLLSNPVPRWHLIASRFVAMTVGLVVILALMSVLTFVGTVAAGVDLPALDLAWAALNLLPFSLFFGGLALLLSAVLRRSSVVIAIPAGILVAMYVLNGLAGSVASFQWARHVSLFNYYGSAILNGIRWADFLGILVVAVAFALLAILAFRRRDILI